MRCHISFFQTKCLPVELQLNDNPVRCSIDQLCGYLSEHVYNFCIYGSFLSLLKEQSVIVYFQCPLLQLQLLYNKDCKHIDHN